MEEGKPGSRGMDFRVVGNKHWRDGIAWQGRLYGYVSKADQWYEAVRAAKTGGILPVQYAGVLGFHEQEISSIGYIFPISHRGRRHPWRFGRLGDQGAGRGGEVRYKIWTGDQLFAWRKWTAWTYCKGADAALNDRGDAIIKIMEGLKKWISME